jgi:hypothetical protein
VGEDNLKMMRMASPDDSDYNSPRKMQKKHKGLWIKWLK